MSDIKFAKTRPPWMHPIRWLYVQARREACRKHTSRPEVGTAAHVQLLRATSKIFHRELKRHGFVIHEEQR